MTPRRRRLGFGLLVVLALFAWGVLLCHGVMIRMPGRSYDGPLAPLTAEERGIRDNLVRHVRVLADEIGERHLLGRRPQLDRTAEYLTAELGALGYRVASSAFEVRGDPVRNIEVRIPGTTRPEQTVVVGAHYDSAEGTPGANDNGSAVAAVLELARLLRDDRPDRDLRLVFFVNEEPPWFQTGDMGSLRYAEQLRREGGEVTAMLSIETIGYYSDERGSQHYPAPLSLAYPDRGNFIAFVGNVGSRGLVRRCIGLFRDHADFPSEGAALPSFLPGIGWSDHWAFWQQGWPAVMVTDTALFRYPHYHEPSDTPDKVDFERTARVVRGLADVVWGLASD